MDTYDSLNGDGNDSNYWKGKAIIPLKDWIQKTVRKISKDKNILDIDAEQQRRLEIDEKGLKKYLDLVIREVRKVDKKNH